MSILIVEDDDGVGEALVSILRDEGYVAEIASNGAAALRRLAARPLPTLILLDLMMPQMNGWEFRRLQLQDPAIAAIPVLLLTGAGTAAKSIDELHVAGTIEKPVELETLLAEVAHYCA